MRLEITLGAGVNAPGGVRRTVEAEPGAIVQAFADALNRLPAVNEGWVCGAVFNGDHRATAHWQAASVVFGDSDSESKQPLTADQRAAIEEKAAAGVLPGSAFYLTPRGYRVAFVLAEPITDHALALRAHRAVAGLLDRVNAELPGIATDRGATVNAVQLMFLPNAIVRGVARKATVQVLRTEPYALDELLGVERAPEGPTVDVVDFDAQARERQKQKPQKREAKDVSELGVIAAQPAPPIADLGDSRLDAARDALRYLCPEDRETWFLVACALFHGFPDQREAARDAWIEYSRRSAKCDEAGLAKWDTIQRDDGPKKPTAWLFATARAAGWDGDDGRFPVDGLAGIEVRPGRRAEIARMAEEALLASPWLPPVFQRDGELVRVVRLDKRASVAKAAVEACTAQIVPVSASYLGGLFMEAASFFRYSKTEKERVQVDCPQSVVDFYLSWFGEWRVPHLHAVAAAPTMRADGSVLQEPGYDEQSGVLYEPGEVVFPRVPDAPTLDDARAAVRKLLEPVALIPWATPRDRSTWLAAVLSVFVRPAIDSCPMILIDSPARGSGKTKLAAIVSLIASGTYGVSLAPLTSDEEWSKTLFAVLRRGPATVLIDNVVQPLGCPSLDSIMTKPVHSARVLGESRDARVSTAAVFIATGNNIRAQGDFVTRCLRCRIDAGVERPEARDFDFDPVERARQMRPELVAAALTVLRGHVVAGSPFSGEGDRFAQWARRIRGALTWVGEPDPAETRRDILADDDAHVGWTELLRAWHGAFRGKATTVAEAMTHEAVSDAAAVVVGDVDPDKRTATLGRRMATQRGRIFGGLRLDRGENARNASATWAAVDVEVERRLARVLE